VWTDIPVGVNLVFVPERHKIGVNVNLVFPIKRNAIAGLVFLAYLFRKQPV
jgi:hypothetical protein